MPSYSLKGVFHLFFNGLYPVYQPIYHLAKKTVIAYNVNFVGDFFPTPIDSKLKLEICLYLSADNIPEVECSIILPAKLTDLAGLLENGRLEHFCTVQDRYRQMIFEMDAQDLKFDLPSVDMINRIRGLGFSFSINHVQNSFEMGRKIEQIKPEYLKLDPVVLKNRDSVFIHSMIQFANANCAHVIMQDIQTEDDLNYATGFSDLYGQGEYFETYTLTS